MKMYGRNHTGIDLIINQIIIANVARRPATVPGTTPSGPAADPPRSAALKRRADDDKATGNRQPTQKHSSAAPPHSYFVRQDADTL